MNNNKRKLFLLNFNKRKVNPINNCYICDNFSCDKSYLLCNNLTCNECLMESNYNIEKNNLFITI